MKYSKEDLEKLDIQGVRAVVDGIKTANPGMKISKGGSKDAIIGRVLAWQESLSAAPTTEPVVKPAVAVEPEPKAVPFVYTSPGAMRVRGGATVNEHKPSTAKEYKKLIEAGCFKTIDEAIADAGKDAYPANVWAKMHRKGRDPAKRQAHVERAEKAAREAAKK